MVHALPLLLLMSTAHAGDDGPLPLVVRAPLQALWPAPAAPPPPPVRLLPGRLDVDIDPDGREARLSLRFDFELLADDAINLPIVGAALTLRSARLDGRRVALPPDTDGWRRLAGTLATGRHVLELTGSVATPSPSLDLPVVEASRTRITVRDGWELSSPDGVHSTAAALDLPPTSKLSLSWQEPRAASPRPRVVQASAATALRVDATGVLGHSRVRFRVRHQPTDSLRIALPMVDDLQIEGPALASWDRQGGDLVLHLVEPVLGAVGVELSWRATAPGREGEFVALPRPNTTSGRVDEGFVSVLAGDQGTPVVLPGQGLTAVPERSVATWGLGMVPGSPLLSMSVTGPRPALRVQVLDLSPADEPPTVVDDARITVAYAAHGRALVRCRYQVRNDKNQYLGMSLPPHARLLGVRVAGEVVQPVTDEVDGDEPEARRLFIPLEKSVETLQGLVSFPVEVMLLVDTDPWKRRGQRRLQAPALDAPVATARWELLLPSGVHLRDVQGKARRVDESSPPGPSLAYGRASSSSTERVEELRRQQSQEAWNQAYRAYKNNDFEQARDLLDQSLQLDSSNRAAQALDENVELLLGDADAEGQEEQARRIRALARAKTGDLANEQTELEEALLEAERAGDADRAESLLDRYTKVTRKLVQVEDEEAVEQKARLAEAQKKRQEIGKLEEWEKRQRFDNLEEFDQRSADAGAVSAGGLQALSALGYVEGETVEGGTIGGLGEGRGGVAGEGRGAGLLAAGASADGALPGEVPTEATGAWEDEAEAEPEAVTLITESRGRRVSLPRVSFGSRKEVAKESESFAAPVPAAATTAAPEAAKDDDATRDDDVTGASTAGGEGRATLSPPPPPTRPDASRGPVPTRPPLTQPSALAMDPEVTAAPLITDVPHAGPRLLLQQQLLAPGQALTATLTYRLDD